MKRILFAIASVFAIAPAAHAQYAYDPYARVIESSPVYTTATREECWNPNTGSYEERHAHTDIGAGAALGALAGGVLGHQIDHGAGTAAGAILGGVIGHQIEKDQDRRDDLDLTRCRVVSYDQMVHSPTYSYAYR